MSCYHQLRARRRPDGTVQILKKSDTTPHSMRLPCRQCINCRLAQSREWALRLSHEAQTHDEKGLPSCFITLTYDAFHLPHDYSLNKDHFAKFMKSLRSRHQGKTIKFFHCGEYGEKFSRPHYHALLFGIDFPDAEYHSTTNGQPVFKSAELAKIWKRGYNTVGDVTYESAAYVARYVTKKITGHAAHEHYLVDCPLTGQLHSVQPEYITMSLKPEGLGADFFKKYISDMYPHGTTLANNFEVTTPRYYDKLYERINPDEYKKLQTLRSQEAAKLEQHPDNTAPRLKVREFVHKSKAKLLRRSYESPDGS